MEFSLYTSVKSTEPKTIDLTNYITFVKVGYNQDLVLQARAVKNDYDKYKELKLKSPAILGSCIMNNGKKENDNIKYLNGFIVIDIDTDINDNLLISLQNDQYTHVLHRSFGGDGVCIFVKINPELFKESFNQLAQYYYEKYGIVVDQACKNKNRLRFISYDPFIFYNEKSLKFKAKKEKEKELNIPRIAFRGDDFDNILKQIKDKNIDLIKGDYSRFVQIGFALFSKFGDAGKDHFEFINSYNPRFKPQNLDKDWKGFRNIGPITIATFYYYCKEEGIQLYTNETKQIINAVKVAKINKITNSNDVLKNIKDVHGFEADTDFVNELMNSDIDYSIGINSELTEIEVLTNYINDVFQPFYDTLTGLLYIKNWVAVTDVQENDIYISVRKNLNDKIKLADIRAVLCSSEIKKINVLNEFLKDIKQANIIVGHNVQFDRKMIVSELLRLSKENHISQIIDMMNDDNFECTMIKTTHLCKLKRKIEYKDKITGEQKFFYKLKSPKLTEAYEYFFGYAPVREALHDALVDTIICLRVYLKYNDLSLFTKLLFNSKNKVPPKPVINPFV